MDLIKFLGWSKTFASFKIDEYIKTQFNKLIVAHEGNWIEDFDPISCHKDYKSYEDVQKNLGKGLTFVEKKYYNLLNRSIFIYDFDREHKHEEYILAVPATGEEIYFEIYGIDRFGKIILLVEREL